MPYYEMPICQRRGRRFLDNSGYRSDIGHRNRPLSKVFHS